MAVGWIVIKENWVLPLPWQMQMGRKWGGDGNGHNKKDLLNQRSEWIAFSRAISYILRMQKLASLPMKTTAEVQQGKIWNKR
jgi:hypothetical protein